MATTINGVSRYAVTGSNIVKDEFAGMDKRHDRLETVNLSLGNASTSATVYVSAPAGGKLVGMKLVDATGATTTDVTVTNNSNSDAAMVSATNITTVADTAFDLYDNFSTTAANLAVDGGDLLTVTVAQAGGLCSAVMYFETTAD